jgi:DNA invertase Pin-like site-specific DNA recombinase
VDSQIDKPDLKLARGKFVSYLRVSTARQGRSGLGLEAQRQAVMDYLDGGRWRLLGEYVEVESGRVDDRPQLVAALHRAKVTGATLIVAKLDRLSRDLAFLANLQKSGAHFLAADMPEANELTIHVMAALAQHERRMISERTRQALAAARRRGVKLGNPNGAAALLRAGKGNSNAVASIKSRATERARDILVVIDDIRGDGLRTLQGIADELNAREIRTARGGRWHPTTVRNILQRRIGSAVPAVD